MLPKRPEKHQSCLLNFESFNILGLQFIIYSLEKLQKAGILKLDFNK